MPKFIDGDARLYRVEINRESTGNEIGVLFFDRDHESMPGTGAWPATITCSAALVRRIQAERGDDIKGSRWHLTLGLLD